MDAKKIGAFIAQQHRLKQLTQKQLGESLGISDKTVSKWECGYGLPDISIIAPLCAALEITINELLSGEQLAQEEYPEKAEENMIQLMQENNKTSKTNLLKIILINTCIFAAGLAIAMIHKSEVYYNTVNFLEKFRIAELMFLFSVSLWTAGCLKDFGHAFLLLFRKASYPQQLAHAILAISTAQKALLYASALNGIFRMILVFGEPEFRKCLSALPINLAEFFVTLFYGVLCAFLLEPVKSRLKKKQIDI